MSASKLDAVYRSILLTKFFTKGWGKPENLRRLFEFRKVVSNREECFKLVERDYPVTITKEQNLADCKLIEGYFVSPLERYLPGIVPEIAQKAHFQALLPIHWPNKEVKPVCLHLAGTGDHIYKNNISFPPGKDGSATAELILNELAENNDKIVIFTAKLRQDPLQGLQKLHICSANKFFWRRRNLMVKPLIKEAGIGGIILENPFYGLRKPTDQVRSSLHNVSDIFVMGGCLILESLVLFHWCERNGLGPLGVTGLSMGGHMASLAATNWPKPLVLVPCLSWSTASAVFLQGVMSQSINWDMLEDQYLSDGDYREKLSKMVTIIDEAFLAGKKFARTYTQYSQSAQPNSNVNSEKNLDITYKENKSANEPVIDLSKNVQINKVPAPPKSVFFKEIESLRCELKKLLDEKKISEVLYDKLTSNEKFVLDPQDIDDINKLTEERIKEMLLKCKVASIKDESCQQNINTDAAITEENAPKTPKVETDNAKPLKINTQSAQSPAVLLNTEAQIAPTDILKSTTEKENTPVIENKRKEKSSWNISDITSHWIDLSFFKSSEKKIDISKIHWRDREALQFMRGIMDECTHLSNFTVPFDTSLIIAVCAKHDAYVPRDDVGTLEEIWPGAEVRYVDAGHVSAYILHQSLFRACIKEAFERSKKKWKDGKHID